MVFFLVFLDFSDKFGGLRGLAFLTFSLYLFGVVGFGLYGVI